MTTPVDDLIGRIPALTPVRDAIDRAVDVTADAIRAGGTVLVCGNGGSASDSEHLVADLAKGFLSSRPIPAQDRQRLRLVGGERGLSIADRLQGALPAIALPSQAALMTAVGNDVDYEMVFAQQVFGLGRAGDVLIAISTTGNSVNVINAALVARARSMPVVALTGRHGGDLAGIADVAIQVPADRVYEIQELHMPVYHALALALEERFFGEARA